MEPVPSLVSLVSHDPDCKKMMGLALKNVTLTLLEDGKAIFDEQGEMLFTHFGISGPDVYKRQTPFCPVCCPARTRWTSTT